MKDPTFFIIGVAFYLIFLFNEPPRKMHEAAGTSVSKKSEGNGRVCVTKAGKTFTVPREQLEQAINEGYSEAK
jgi:hypothetical protein